MSKLIRFAATALFVIAAIHVSGCADNSQAQKLEAPEGIDWAAIEAGDAEIEATQSVGE